MKKYKEIVFSEIISRYRAGERDFSGVMIDYDIGQNWDREYFQGLDLSGIILRDSNISWIGHYMQGVILRGADLTNVDLGECCFENADLSNSILRGTEFWQSVVDGANFSGADLTGAALMDSTFDASDMSRVNFNEAGISGVHFSTNLTDATFHRARLSGVTFSCRLRGVDFKGAKFSTHRDYRKVTFTDRCRFENTIMPDGSIRNPV